MFDALGLLAAGRGSRSSLRWFVGGAARSFGDVLRASGGSVPIAAIVNAAMSGGFALARRFGRESRRSAGASIQRLPGARSTGRITPGCTGRHRAGISQLQPVVNGCTVSGDLRARLIACVLAGSASFTSG